MTPVGIALNGAEFIADPYPAYQRLREVGSPCWIAHSGTTGGMWFFTQYEDVAAVLKEARVSKDVSRLLPPEMITPLETAMLFKDPPDHTRLRTLVGQTFTPARIKDLEPRITQIVDALIAQALRNGGMDFIAEFALPLPVIVIAELLGVPREDHARFGVWSNSIIRGVDTLHATANDGMAHAEAIAALSGYFADLIRKRRLQPQHDILSALIATQDAQGHLSEDELLGTCILLLVAGHETTVNLLGNGLYTLLRHPEQHAKVRQTPELIAPAVEEMLRYESPVQRATFRFTREGFTVKGATLEAGQQVSAVLGAANRDPAQFPDANQFDVTRAPNRHLGFGLGIHFCLGAALARSEARIGFERLLSAMPALSLVSQTPQWNGNTIFRGLTTLPVVF